MKSEKVAEKLRKNRINIINAINIFIEKKDDDLKWQLEQEGYADVDGTVEQMNEYEEHIEDILQEQTKDAKKAAVDAMKQETEPKRWERLKSLIYWIAAGKTYEEAEKLIAAGRKCGKAVLNPELASESKIARMVAEETKKMMKKEVPKLANIYMKESDGELVIDKMRKRTSAWMEEWSEELGRLMHITTHDQLTAIIEDGLKNGKSVAEVARKIQDGGFRNEYYQAHRVALTEMLRAHSVAREESIQQSPSVTKREWVHTGSHKNEPRLNHMKISGQIKKKDEPFDLVGADGNIYHPMFPRDTLLPAKESVNCHCTHRGIVDKDILGMSLEERKAMQQKIIEEDDGAWERELDEKNKRKAGINEGTVNYDWIRKKSKEDQIKYFGGGYAGKQRWALLESGVIADDKGIEQMYKRSKKGRRSLKTIEELHKDGIITVREKTIRHSVDGEYRNAYGPYPNGRMIKGGHTQKTMEICNEKGIWYEVNYEFSNGVRCGNVEGSNSKRKITGNGQLWFPKEWEEDDVIAAGTKAANTGEKIGEKRKIGTYKGVAVRVIFDDNNEITTICPDFDQEKHVEGVKKI